MDRRQFFAARFLFASVWCNHHDGDEAGQSQGWRGGAEMRSSLMIAALAACLLMLACARAGIIDQATFSKHDKGYSVEMKARRRPLAHDPISAILGRTYEETLTIELPRIEGVIDAAEIPVRAGYIPYKGRVAIANRKMNVDLYYDDPADRAKHALPWNGEYTLAEKRTPGAR